MDRIDVLLELRRANLCFQRDEFIIIAGANLAMRGFERKNFDVDILVSNDLWDLLQDGWTSSAFQSSVGLVEVKELVGGHVEATKNVSLPGMWCDFLTVPWDLIDDYRVETLEHIRAWKARCGRPKDLKDLDDMPPVRI